MAKPNISVIMCAYNEEKNIEKLLLQVLDQKLSYAPIKEILVVSSGSTDGTDAIVTKIPDKKISLLREPKRLGKVSAVNLGLSHAKGDLIILCSADVQLERFTFQKLVEKFNDSKIGMVGAHPIPTNNPESFSGFCSHLVWSLHHEIALHYPKCGEVVAFRNFGYSIPNNSPIDEAYLEHHYVAEGYRLAYAPEAIVHNHGPESITDFLRQRRRIHSQHLFLKNKMKYMVSTSNPRIVFSAFFKTLKFDPISLLFTFGAVKLEILSMLLGAYDFYIKKNYHTTWEMVETTKAVK
ncbi:Glycosyltransferase AglE [Candidatus Bilamarchaeum dharawalense]|uniref:Glycosyltransferase AglE n=1 Tax=Candidatus Bilamarchaeum dharawalense TaxID=2885759 RepID=A0A5E4LQN9_9ARCH|nr:Glycosyltransferase AglE [Candidatus Bilamarchaeum dharawalense]